MIQHAFREDRQLAFAGADLSSSVNDLLNDEVLTFLRRADRHELGSVDLESVRRAIREPVVRAGRTFQPGALEVMVDGTGGYPFLIQLFGSQCWRVRPGGKTITKADAESGTQPT